MIALENLATSLDPTGIATLVAVLPQPFQEESGWGVSSVNYDRKSLLERTAKS